jgi:hypothetical protein
MLQCRGDGEKGLKGGSSSFAMYVWILLNRDFNNTYSVVAHRSALQADTDGEIASFARLLLTHLITDFSWTI